MLDAGVSFYMSTSSLAAGVGVLAEEYAPYCNAEGNDLREGDWTLPEKLLFPAGSCVGITVLQSGKTAFELCALMAEAGLTGTPRD